MTNPAVFTQISTQVGWLRIYTPTCWWKPGSGKAMPCPPTARCPNTLWTSSGFGSPGQSFSIPATTTPSGVCRRPSRTGWPAWGIWTERGPKCGAEEGWSAPLIQGSTQPSGSWWTGTLDVEKDFMIVFFFTTSIEYSISKASGTGFSELKITCILKLWFSCVSAMDQLSKLISFYHCLKSC